MTYLIIVFLSFLIIVIFTPYMINFLIAKNLVDNPNGEERRIHTQPIPRMGGVIVFVVIMITTLIFYHDIESKKYFFLGAITVFALGIVDDIKGIRYKVKFLVQGLVAVFLILSFEANHYTEITYMGYDLFPSIVNYAILFVLIIGLLNAFNLMDGLDGLVAGFSLIVTSLCFLFSIEGKYIFIPYLSAAIIGTTLGFLKFNANPARIFLGDSGSLTLGYLVSAAVITISGISLTDSQSILPDSPGSIDIVFILIVLAIPIADTLRVMIVRLNQRKSMFLPDSNHLHHILYGKKIRHKTVVLIIHLFSASFVLLAIYYAKFSKVSAIIIFAIMLAGLFFSHQILDFLVQKKFYLIYGKLYRKIPALVPSLYKNVLLPIVSVLLLFLFIFLILTEAKTPQSIYTYFFFVVILTLIYSGVLLKREKYYIEILVLINIMIFFIITGFNGFFYNLYPVPVINQININQVFIFVLTLMVIFFVLFKERIANYRGQFLTGTDLIIAATILFIYLAAHFINIPASYKISDTLVRSLLVFLIYKIVIIILPKYHFTLYYISFVFALAAVIILWI